MKKSILLTLGLNFCLFYLYAQTIKPYPPVPTKQQLAWHGLEFYFFVHFGPNTFTDKEWGHGDEPEDIFNPTNLDCRQWVRIAKQSGAKGIILTAKHHDGFCLWPSKYSKHTVRESKWKNGKGDVLKELSQACKEYGLKFGVYISPWDRNHPQYGTPEYNDVFINMMKEIFSNYGPIWELWWDGANGEGPNGKKQVYDWRRFETTVRQISPNTVVFSDIGPDIRWVGNEKGIAGKTNWNLLDTAGFARGIGAPHTDTLNQGNAHGKIWVPAECDVSIRPGWFYHAQEDDKVKTSEQLFDLYLKSVGRGANFLLNIPPDRRGLIPPNDSAALIGFKILRERSFERNLVKGLLATHRGHHRRTTTSVVSDGNPLTHEKFVDFRGENISFSFNSDRKVNCVVIQEAIQAGQKIVSGRIILGKGDSVVKEIKFSTVGRKRVITFPSCEVNTIVIGIDEAKATPLISEVEAYFIDEKLVEQ